MRILSAILFLFANLTTYGSVEPWKNPSLDPEIRVADLVQRMTTEEKVAVCYGSFVSGGVPRLGIDPLVLADGPVGIRLMKELKKFTSVNTSEKAPSDEVVTIGVDTIERTTALPGTLALAACWDRSLAEAYASVIGREMRMLNKHVLLAPGVNMMRDPRGGRNFEYFGEDPYLTAEMAIGYVRGLQKYGVSANLKHYVGNECETNRHFTSAKMSERVLREVYNYPFEQAIQQGGAWSLMTGNNLYAGTHVAENKELLTNLLRDKIGFDGVILTDWRSAYQAKPSVQAGLDMTTGFCRYVYGEGNLLKLVTDGILTEADLDRMARHVMMLYLRVGLLGDSLPNFKPDPASHAAIANQVARNSIVLLKNDHNLLPSSNLQTVLLCGPAADQVLMGKGSGLVNDGVGNVSIKSAFIEKFGEAAVKYCENISELSTTDLAVDLVIYCAHDDGGREGSDLKQNTLPGTQAAEIQQLATRTDKLVVALQCGTSVDTTQWDEAADALVVVWYGGEAFGHAVVDALSGEGDFTGRLPCVFGNPLSDWPVSGSGAQWPAKKIRDGEIPAPGFGADRPQAHVFDAEYKEGLLTGHRWFSANNRPQRYPFGYGLSRTEFAFNSIHVRKTGDSFVIEVEVKNTGQNTGTCVVQLYVEDPESSVTRPEKELKGFERIELEAGAHDTAYLVLRRKDLCFFDTENGKWKLEAGEFKIYTGSSSIDLPLTASIQISMDEWL